MLKESTRRWRAWIVVALVFLFMLINFADKAVIGLAAVPMMHDLGLTPGQLGLVGSSFFVLFSISGIVFGFIANRVKTKWLLAILSIVWAAVQFPLVGAVSFPLLIACRVLLGAGEGPAYALAVHATYKWFDNSRRNIPTAIVQQGANMGMLVAGPCLTWLMIHYDWHAAFLALGVVGAIWTMLWLLLGAEGSVDESSKQDATDAPHSVSVSARAEVCAPARVPYRALMSDPTLVGIFLLSFAGFLALSLCFTWFPAYLRLGLGYSATDAGWLFSVIVGAAIPASLVMSWFSQYLFDKGVSSRASRGFITSGAIALTGLTFICMTTGIGAPLKIVCLTLGACFGQLIFLFGPLMIGEVTPPAQRGAWLAINNSIATLAGFVAPALMGRFVGAAHSQAVGFEHGFLFLGSVLVAAGVAALWLIHPERSMRRLRGIAASRNSRERGDITQPACLPDEATGAG
ncbi:MFS transporter [Paraburkholderia gardini]|uniref:Hexuronate transporter n=1 Tax=Paraburkholderia gardini TaxID=2823469 RepID=A0ABM8U5U9_9BURK|nr:MFS transporter [Paraburkholderia gardini]CAG4897518.1 Hexuronate transporter [Paraburkholderia gardini]CAG4904670.1 Hexuronate transporter [Paraburkholderia gardini]